MSKFTYPYAYESRDEAHTSRWLLNGVETTDEGNLTDGRVWMSAVDTDDTVAVTLYAEPACTNSVASGTADISGIDDAPAKCTLSEANDSGLSGEFYFESYTSDPSAVEVLVSLAMDCDLAIEYANLDQLPVYDGTTGMADYLAAATRKVLLQVSQLYADELGGYSAPEHRYTTGASREVPDYRRISNPDQLADACIHWALMLAFGASHEREQGTMYSELRDRHDEKRKEAIQGWNLAINVDPGSDDDADTRGSAAAVSIVRL